MKHSRMSTQARRLKRKTFIFDIFMLLFCWSLALNGTRRRKETDKMSGGRGPTFAPTARLDPLSNQVGDGCVCFERQ